MAKFKFSDSRITEIVAILDKDENDEFIVTLDDESYSLKKILEDHVGDNIQLKFTRDIEWGVSWHLKNKV